jgi:acetylornithine deacetylase/succinyl-diaminopimelate desuccinylase-like protein
MARQDADPSRVLSRSRSELRKATLALRDEVVDLAIAIASVPAPTGEEGSRAKFVAERMRALGIEEVGTDEIHDVVGRVRGRTSGPPLLIAAHLDTVFPSATDLVVTRVNGRISGPGIGDNSLGVASALLLPALLKRLSIVPEVDLLITGNVGEEGLGNLRGIRRVMDDRPEIGAVVALEGHNLGRVTHVAVGSRRIRVVVTGPGGHSWGDFGNANAIHVAGELIAELAKLRVPAQPKTTLSVGMISGGISINTIPPDVTFLVDLRSVDRDALRGISDRVDAVLGAPRSGVSVNVETLGIRPAGTVSPSSRIVKHAIRALDELGLPSSGDASSTDANIPISRDIPAVCIGLTTGGNVHRSDEYIDTHPIADGLAQLVLLTMAIAHDLAAGTHLH